MNSRAKPKSKWITEVEPTGRLTVEARRVLKLRLKQVFDAVPSAARKHPRDPEAVHELRVAIRRAMAALELFDDLLPSKRTAWLKRQLKGLRRAAGSARDLDVLAERWKTQAGAEPNAAWQTLLAQVAADRSDAQIELRKAARKLRRNACPAKAKEVLRRLTWRSSLKVEPSFGEEAANRLRPMMQELLTPPAGDQQDATALHERRIIAKQLRYALEVFGSAFPSQAFAGLYPQIERLQSLLGEVNDHASAAELLKVWSATEEDDQAQVELQNLQQQEVTSLARTRAVYLQEWPEERFVELRAEFESCF